MEKYILKDAEGFNNFNKIKYCGKVLESVRATNDKMKGFFVQYVKQDGSKHDFRIYTPALDIRKLNLVQGNFVMIDGEIHTWNVGQKRVVVSTFTKDVKILSEEQYEKDKHFNHGAFVGHIVRKPFIRHRGGETVTESLVAINDSFRNYSYYIPINCYDDDAQMLKNCCDVGDKIAFEGALQQRAYPKTLEDGTVQERTTYEIAVNKLERWR